MRVAGMGVAARLVEKQRRAHDDGRISAHQLAVNTGVAYVICGGEGTTSARDESRMLALEREKFLELAPLPLTQARLEHLRATGRVLEN
jgi:3-hydroxyacyl-CoA dehydrogenase